MVSPYSGAEELTVEQWDWNVAMGHVQIWWSMGSALFFRTGHISMPSGSRRCGEWSVGYGIGWGFCSPMGIPCLVQNQTAIWYGSIPPSLQECIHH